MRMKNRGRSQRGKRRRMRMGCWVMSWRTAAPVQKAGKTTRRSMGWTSTAGADQAVLSYLAQQAH
jgi:hypothetical protein